MLFGSMAGNDWGTPRSTHDIDFVNEYDETQVMTNERTRSLPLGGNRRKAVLLPPGSDAQREIIFQVLEICGTLSASLNPTSE